MNCKPGDMAIVVGCGDGTKCLGRMVLVMYAPPAGTFTLPNGVTHEPVKRPNSWVVKSLGTPFPGALGNGMYGVGRDCALRPIKGLTDSVEEYEDLRA